MAPLILLFDIDGTLVTTAGAGRRAIERAFLERYGQGKAFAKVAFGGMTDHAIIRAGLTALGRPYERAEAEALLSSYLSLLEDEVARAEGYRLHDGVLVALDRAAMTPGCAIGLGTGNVRAGARVKLARVGVYKRFAFGGFGCDAEDRAELIARGIARGAEHLGAARHACRVVVIGDTPKDVAAARANGAKAVGVGTGPFSVEALLAAGADAAFPDLAAAGALEELSI